jgi:hypothetical protein
VLKTLAPKKLGVPKFGAKQSAKQSALKVLKSAKKG